VTYAVVAASSWFGAQSTADASQILKKWKTGYYPFLFAAAFVGIEKVFFFRWLLTNAAFDSTRN